MSHTYAVEEIKYKKKKIKQPKAVQDGILFAHPFRLYIVGASGSGKTNLLLNMLTKKSMYKGYFDSILVLSPTARQLDESYKVLNLADECYFPPDTEVLETIMEVQQAHIEKKKGKEKSSKTLLILDDIISYKSFVNSPILLKFAVMSRHWNISMIILSQAYHRIPKSIRLQMSAIVYFKGSNKEQEVLSEDFCAPGQNKKEFIGHINRATEDDYSFLCIDLHKRIKDGRYRKNLTEALF